MLGDALGSFWAPFVADYCAEREINGSARSQCGVKLSCTGIWPPILRSPLSPLISTDTESFALGVRTESCPDVNYFFSFPKAAHFVVHIFSFFFFPEASPTLVHIVCFFWCFVVICWPRDPHKQHRHCRLVHICFHQN